MARNRRIRVYPRACGGTFPGIQGGVSRRGLSPRVRGNPSDDSDGPGASRSIPARAGEPRRCRSASTYGRVYPRACGGTVESGSESGVADGLSPRVRGNQTDPGARQGGQGSIPARAGEPTVTIPSQWGHGVYPRACGGTGSEPMEMFHDRGLSPRVRGNPIQNFANLGYYRSIPARAGEPAWCPCAGNWPTVYPRACGGTARWASTPTRRRGLSPRVRGNRSRAARGW